MRAEPFTAAERAALEHEVARAAIASCSSLPAWRQARHGSRAGAPPAAASSCRRPPMSGRSSSTWNRARRRACGCSSRSPGWRWARRSRARARAWEGARGRAARPPRERRRIAAAARLAAGAYFMLLGLAFMMVEVLVLQRTILVIGFPTLNLGLVLATFLVAAGCGSAASSRRGRAAAPSPPARPAWARARWADAASGRAARTARPAAARGPLPRAGRASSSRSVSPWGCRSRAACGCCPPQLRPLVPWLWGVNGVASIAGSALVVAVALQAGLRLTGLLPAALYALAALPLVGFAGEPRRSAVTGAAFLSSPSSGSTQRGRCNITTSSRGTPRSQTSAEPSGIQPQEKTAGPAAKAVSARGCASVDGVDDEVRGPALEIVAR